MKAIIVTTPRTMMAVAAKEAQQCIDAGGGSYFRTFRHIPKELVIGVRIFYVEDGYIRGYGVVSEIINGNMRCGTTGRDWGEGYHVVMSADSWTWIKPIKMKGFQGWRYFNDWDIEIIGSWMDPKPDTRNSKIRED